MRNNLFPAISKHDICFLKILSKFGRIPMSYGQDNLPFTFASFCSVSGVCKTPRRGIYRMIRQYWAHWSSHHRFMLLIRVLLGPCGRHSTQIGPLGVIFRANSTLTRQNWTGAISEVSWNTPIFNRVPTRNNLFPAISKHSEGVLRPLQKSHDITMSSCRERGLGPSRWFIDTGPCTVMKYM